MTQPGLRECPGCGLLQTIPSLAPGMRAVCPRCNTTLRRAREDPFNRGVALATASLILLVVMCTTTLMTVQTAGIVHHADLFSGPVELASRGMDALAVVVLFTTVLAPFVKLLATLYVLAGLRAQRPPRHLRKIFLWVELLNPWSMIEVFVFGVFVAYVKLGDIVQISLGVGVFALLALTIAMVWADAALDRHSVWDELDRKDPMPFPAHRAAAAMLPDAEPIGCDECSLVNNARPGMRCQRCGSVLHERKPNSVPRTWALVIAAAVLYVPANLFPVLTVVQLGAGSPSTILGGVRELISSRMYPLAALVFFASVAVPMLKLVGLAVMLTATQTRRSEWLRDRTRLYLFVRWIGRWSMIDIFMESLLGALVRFGSVVTIQPGVGAVAFCGVVILTMFAAESFDPRLMWDAARTSTNLRRTTGTFPAGQDLRPAA